LKTWSDTDGPLTRTTASTVLAGAGVSGQDQVDQGQTGKALSRKTYKDFDSHGKR